MKLILRMVGIIGSICIFSSCSPRLIIKDDPSVKEIAVCTEMSDQIPDSLKTEIDSITNKFIADYNSENRKYQLIKCQNDNQRTLYLDVLRITITDPGAQAGGVVVTTLGVIAPFALIAMGSPIYFCFAYLPRSSITSNMKFSKDIAQEGKPQTRQINAESGKYFGSYEKQKFLLFNGYYNRLRTEMTNIENKYKH